MRRFITLLSLLILTLAFSSASLSDLKYYNGDWHNSNDQPSSKSYYSNSDHLYHSGKIITQYSNYKFDNEWASQSKLNHEYFYQSNSNDENSVQKYNDLWEKKNYWAKDYYNTKEYYLAKNRDYYSGTYLKNNHFDNYPNSDTKILYKISDYDYKRDSFIYSGNSYLYRDSSNSDSSKTNYIYLNPTKKRDVQFKYSQDKVIYLNGKKIIYSSSNNIYSDNYDYKIYDSKFKDVSYLKKCYVNPPNDVLFYRKC